MEIDLLEHKEAREHELLDRDEPFRSIYRERRSGIGGRRNTES